MQIILVIEDNAEIRENTVELLELHNYQVFSAVNGNIGFEMAKELKPDLVLCDMMMPDTDGREFLRLAKSNSVLRNIPLIFFSAGSPMPEIKKFLIKESDDYLEKPFAEEELLNSVKRVLERA
jgi:Response regulators consisting of a CheY-like receiver domain and a winged-helix DNA-binding domain